MTDDVMIGLALGCVVWMLLEWRPNPPGWRESNRRCKRKREEVADDLSTSLIAYMHHSDAAMVSAVIDAHSQAMKEHATSELHKRINDQVNDQYEVMVKDRAKRLD